MKDIFYKVLKEVIRAIASAILAVTSINCSGCLALGEASSASVFQEVTR